MPKQQILEEVHDDDGGVYQLLYTPGAAAAWVIVIDGVLDSSYDEYSVAMHAWRDITRNA